MHLHTIHQTEKWAEFRKTSKGEKYFAIEVDGEKTDLLAYVQKMPLPYGKSWLYCNRGPVFHKLTNHVFKKFIDNVKQVAKSENAVFLRIEPPYHLDSDDGDHYEKLVHEFGFRNAHASHQPDTTLVIDLELTQDEILAQMKPKGRYNIKLAKKKGVKVLAGAEAIKRLDDFHEILKETTNRDGFTGHGKSFYKQMLESLEDKAELYLAEYEGDIIAGLLATFFEDTVTYYYGASSNQHRNVMAPYLLQWHAIMEAQKREYKYYDFLGISPPHAKNHPWKGVTAFKQKFGGDTVEYIKAKEFVFKPFWYWIIVTVKKIKKLLP